GALSETIKPCDPIGVGSIRRLPGRRRICPCRFVVLAPRRDWDEIVGVRQSHEGVAATRSSGSRVLLRRLTVGRGIERSEIGALVGRDGAFVYVVVVAMSQRNLIGPIAGDGVVQLRRAGASSA